MARNKISIEERFWNNVNKTDFCWEWTACKMTRGYGQIMHNGKSVGAHRVALILSGRKIPKDYDVMHICDNKGCVNPAHLKAVPHKENMNDFSNKYALTSESLKKKEGDSEVLSAFKKYVLLLGGILAASKKFNVTPACIYQKLNGFSQINGDMLLAAGYERKVICQKINHQAAQKRKERRNAK